MPSFLTRTQPDPLTMVERQLNQQRAIARTEGNALAARQVARIDAIAEVTEEAMLSAAEVATFAEILIRRTPFAAEELQFIARTGIAAMGEVVLRTNRRCGS